MAYYHRSPELGEGEARAEAGGVARLDVVLVVDLQRATVTLELPPAVVVAAPFFFFDWFPPCFFCCEREIRLDWSRERTPTGTRPWQLIAATLKIHETKAEEMNGVGLVPK